MINTNMFALKLQTRLTVSCEKPIKEYQAKGSFLVVGDPLPIERLKSGWFGALSLFSGASCKFQGVSFFLSSPSKKCQYAPREIEDGGVRITKLNVFSPRMF